MPDLPTPKSLPCWNQEKTEADKRLQQRIQEKHHDLLPDLKNLYALYKVLNKSRRERGALDFESTETRIIFSEKKKN
ncbi:hypothetical protein JYU22_03475 [Gammaproteobacteria bacterium AH-315-E17]|nr:hypothetical protein [Gammaproteobacteria bacterium AH-315-E17]